MQIGQIDPRDHTAFAAWFRVLEASERDLRPGETGSLLHEQQRKALVGAARDADVRTALLAVHDAGDVVGAARLELPQNDNRHLVEVDLAVHPSARRRGAGRALVQAVERLARADGRTTVIGFADEPPGSEGRSPGRLVLARLGYAVAQEEVRRDLDLPLEPARVVQLEGACRPHAGDYALRTWVDHVPEDLVDDRAELSRQMSTDVPKDDLDWREEVWDAARIRRDEELALSMDRRRVATGAVHVPTGRMVAFTEMGVPRAAPQRAYQWETLVTEPHRGHRLGLLLKLTALEELAARSPETTVISTWNAQENAPMIAVNEALGARVNGRLAILQKVLR
jgi:GNAT superfamily N-acetyltransferase